MTEILNPLLTLILLYGYPVLVAIIIAGYLGLPLPVSLCLVAAGAFAVDGTLNIFVLFPLITLTAVSGDIIEYSIGRKFGELLLNRLNKSVKLQKINPEVFFRKWNGFSVFITRWLLTPIAIPVNLIAGLSKYSFRKFIIICLLGESIWSLIYLLLGYTFGANWVALSQYINDTPLFIFAISAGVMLVLLGYRMIKK